MVPQPMSASAPSQLSPPHEPPVPASAAPSGAIYAVTVLTAMNLLNYIDRWIPSAVKDLFKVDLGLTDAQTSLPLTAFVFVYMLASPVFGSLSDRWPRKVVIAAGVAVWSLATGAAAFATGFWTFLLARALVGVGEAAYATLSPALISDFYPPARRNFILTLFYVAIPVGSAIGFALGGMLGASVGWRAAFMICGFPGILAAAAVLWVKEPGRGTFDADKNVEPPGWPEALRILRKNREYVLAVVGYTLCNFGIGALGDWFPTYLHRLRGVSLDEAGKIMGVAVTVGALGGTIVGGLLADRLRGKTRHPYLMVSGISMAVATVLGTMGLLVRSLTVIIVLIVTTQFFMWFYNGPINTVLVNCVSSSLRARAFSLSILAIHILGDAISPPIVGWIADVTGDLTLAVIVIPVSLVLGTAVWIYAWRTLPEQDGQAGRQPA